MLPFFFAQNISDPIPVRPVMLAMPGGMLTDFVLLSSILQRRQGHRGEFEYQVICLDQVIMVPMTRKAMIYLSRETETIHFDPSHWKSMKVQVLDFPEYFNRSSPGSSWGAQEAGVPSSESKGNRQSELSKGLYLNHS